MQGSKKQASEATHAKSMFSPLGSAEGTMAYTPAVSTYLDSSPMSSPTADPTLDPSMVAVRGSVPPSPILKARRLKDSGYFNLPRARENGDAKQESQEKTEDWDDEKVLEDLARSASLDSAVDGGIGPEAKLQYLERIAKAGRVIAIDCDVLIPEYNTSGEVSPVCGKPLAVFSDDDKAHSPLSPTEKRGATSGLLLALRQLRALGHPIHLVSDRPGTERQAILHWLARHSISIGTKDQDVVAALWLDDSGPGPAEQVEVHHRDSPRRQNSTGMTKVRVSSVSHHG